MAIVMSLLLAVAVMAALGVTDKFAGGHLKDAMMRISKALPNGAASIVSAPLDLGGGSVLSQRSGSIQYILTAPPLSVAQLANGATMTYDVLNSDYPDMSDPTVLMPGVIVQTGAGGVGAAAKVYYFRVPTNAQRYLGFKATNSGAGDCSASSVLMEGESL